MKIDVVFFREEMAEAVSALVCRALRETNSADYPPEEIERLCAGHSPEEIRRMAGEGTMFAALLDGEPVGVLRLGPSRERPDELWLNTVFVRPDCQGGGVGRRLMEEAEREARRRGALLLGLGSSITARGFYRRLGFADRTGSPEEGGVFLMRKPLEGTQLL